MKLSIIIPAYNEEKTIFPILEAVYKLQIKSVTKEVIIVNDGSSDATSGEVKKAKEKFTDLIIIEHVRNAGKGAAVVSGIKKATGDYILIQDADLEYNPKDIPVLLTPIINNKAVVVYGTRLKRLPNFKRDERNIQFFIQYMGNKFLSMVTSIFYGQWITDMETGYKIFPVKALQGISLKARSFDFEPEITAKLLKQKYKIYEIPISTNPRGYEEGKKLNALKDGPIALWTLIKYRFIE